MNESPLTVELSCRLTSEQITLWRQAASRASTEQESKASAKAFFRSYGFPAQSSLSGNLESRR
jgi:hypothetical protein